MINKRLENFSDIFQGQKNIKLKIDKYLPKNISYLLSLGFDNANNLYKNKNLFLQNHNSLWQKNKIQNKIHKEHQFNYTDFIDNISDEAGIFACPSLEDSEEQISYIKTKNAVLTIGLLQNIVIKSEEVKYKKYSIGKMLNNILIPNLFSDIINYSDKPYFTNIDNYIFFASSAEALKYIIDKYNGEQTLKKSSSFKKYKNIISDNFNLLLYINNGENTLSAFKHNLNNNLKINIDSLEKFTGLSFQLSNNRNMLINNISLLHDKKHKENIRERWFIQLDSTIHMSPNIVYNHFTQKNDILVQDKTKNLYFISTDGNIRWKRKIHDYILGDISEVDFYNNEKNQFLFNTNDKLYLIDRNGEDVENYPIKLPENTKLGHSLFDYEKNKKYRILVVGENNIIYNLDIKGKKVIGWKFEKISEKIVSKPKHFTNNKKDYIICPTNENQLYLLARNGSQRSTLKLNNKLTVNEIKIDNNEKLYSIDNEGKLWIANINGASNNIEIPKLDRNSQLYIRNIDADTIKQEIIFSNQNILYILNKNFHLIHKNEFDSKIINFFGFNKDNTPYLLVQTEEKTYLLANNDIINKNTIEIKGKNIFKIIDDKINIINSNNDFIFSYDLSLISN